MITMLSLAVPSQTFLEKLLYSKAKIKNPNPNSTLFQQPNLLILEALLKLIKVNPIYNIY